MIEALGNVLRFLAKKKMSWFPGLTTVPGMGCVPNPVEKRTAYLHFMVMVSDQAATSQAATSHRAWAGQCSSVPFGEHKRRTKVIPVVSKNTNELKPGRASRTVDCHLAKCDPPDQDSGTSAVSSLASSMNAVSAARTAPSLVANASTILLVGRSMSSAYHIVLLPLCQITGPPAELRS